MKVNFLETLVRPNTIPPNLLMSNIFHPNRRKNEERRIEETQVVHFGREGKNGLQPKENTSEFESPKLDKKGVVGKRRIAQDLIPSKLSDPYQRLEVSQRGYARE